LISSEGALQFEGIERLRRVGLVDVESRQVVAAQ